jgi:NAD(P)H-hydrate epimerase
MDAIALTREQCRKLDRRATAEYGIPSIVLMENAGRGCVDVLERLGVDGPVVILCGKGNNAGDGFVIARHLAIRGYECRVLLLCPPIELRGDAAINYTILDKTDVPVIEMATSLKDHSTEIRKRLERHGSGAAWLIDAMLGTGARGEPRPPFDAAINWMNVQLSKKLAVDVPSGLDCDTGQPATHTIRADHTCTFAALKIGFTQPTAQPFTGTIHVCDIGAPLRLIEEVAANRIQ